MSKFCGKDFLLQVDDGASGYATVGGLRSTGLTINNEQVDVTDKGDAPWRALLENCGVRSMSISGSGIFSDDQWLEDVQGYALDGTIQTYKIISGNGDYFIGDFQVASVERNGEYNGAEQYSLSLESSGPVAYPAAP